VKNLLLIFEANIQISLLYYQAAVIRVESEHQKGSKRMVAVIMTIFDISQICHNYSCLNEVQLNNEYGQITYQLIFAMEISGVSSFRVHEKRNVS
jgi:hypothetical protein